MWTRIRLIKGGLRLKKTAILLDFILYTWILMLIVVIWKWLEIIFDGGIQPSISDSIIGIVMAYSLKSNFYRIDGYLNRNKGGDEGMKPMKYTFKEFLLDPIIFRIQYKILSKLGWWYCDYCHKRHSPRTIKFSNGQIIHRKEFCSLGREEETKQ